MHWGRSSIMKMPEFLEGEISFSNFTRAFSHTWFDYPEKIYSSNNSAVILYGEKARTGKYGIVGSGPVNAVAALLLQLAGSDYDFSQVEYIFIPDGSRESALYFLYQSHSSNVDLGIIEKMPGRYPLVSKTRALENLKNFPVIYPYDWLYANRMRPYTTQINNLIRVEPGERYYSETISVVETAIPETDALEHPDELSWIAYVDPKDGKVIGAVGANTLPIYGGGQYLSIHGLGVLPEARGQGIGGALMDGIVNKALISKHEFVTLGVWINNLGARYLYHKIGWIPGERVAIWWPDLCINA